MEVLLSVKRPRQNKLLTRLDNTSPRMEVLLSVKRPRQNKLLTRLENTSPSDQLSAPATISVISCVMLA